MTLLPVTIVVIILQEYLLIKYHFSSQGWKQLFYAIIKNLQYAKVYQNIRLN